MAWENYSLSPILKTGIYNGNWESNTIRPTTTSGTTTLFGHSSDFDFSDADAYDLSNGTSELPTGKFYGDEHNYLMRNSNGVIQIYYNDTLIGRLPFSLVYVNRYTIYAGINEELHQAKLFGIAWNSDTSVNPNVYFGSFMDAEQSPTYPNYYEKLYTILKSQVPPITYNWQSVPSISGKNGILHLARIKDDYINDGEPVSGAAKSRFSNLKDGNKVSVLIENVLPDPAATGTDITVKYDVPSLSSGSYTYCKLVTKKNSMPESVEDGNKIIDLDPTKASVTVKYLSGNTKYYFEIFTQDSEGHEAVSNVKSITTGEAHDIILFTDEFNDDILVDNWDIAVYKPGWGNGNNNWNPSQFASDFLTAYNFLIGNYSKRTLYLGDSEITADQKTSTTDATFWIPIKRSNITENFKIEFDAKVSPLGYSDYSYNYTWVAVGCVDSNNNWHQSAYAGGIPGQDWVHYSIEITGWTYGYIDYIGLSDCDGKPHFKNIQVTVG